MRDTSHIPERCQGATRPAAASDQLAVSSEQEPLAVSRKPIALPDAPVYELYGLTKDEIRIVEGG